jgi:hypothetical protein
LLWPLVSDQLECLDEEDGDDWLHPHDPRYRTRNLLRDLGLRGAATVPLPSVERAATQGATSGYMTLLFRLTDLIADDVIRPRSSFPDADEAVSFAEVLGLADVETFEDLWLSGVLSGLLRGSHDTPVPAMTRAEFDGLPVEGRLMRACEVGQSRIRRLRYEETGSGAIALIVWSLLQGGGWVSLAAAAEVGAREDYWYEDDRLTLAAAELDTCLEVLADAGVVERELDRARLTDFGMWAADLWVEDVFEGP